jgi:hypothetical protein
LRNVHDTDLSTAQTGLAHVGDDPDDLAGRLFKLRPQTFADDNCLADRVPFRPILPDHFVVDNGHSRRISGVGFPEHAAAQQANFERLKVVRRDRSPLLVARILALRGRFPHDVEGKVDTALHREHHGGGRGFDARQAFDAAYGLGDEVVHPCCCRVVGARHGRLQGEYVMRVETRVYVLQPQKSADQQCRADQQNKRQGNFRYNQDGPCAMLSPARARTSRGFFERGGEVRVGGAQRRVESENDSRQQGDSHGECGHAPVERGDSGVHAIGIGKPRNVSRGEQEQAANAYRTKPKPQNAAQSGKDDTFREQLSHHA